MIKISFYEPVQKAGYTGDDHCCVNDNAHKGGKCGAGEKIPGQIIDQHRQYAEIAVVFAVIKCRIPLGLHMILGPLAVIVRIFHIQQRLGGFNIQVKVSLL